MTAQLIIEQAGQGVRRRLASGPAGFLDDAIASLTGWSSRYGRAVVSGDEVALSRIGEEMFGWLDAGGMAAGWVGAAGDRVLEVRVDPALGEAAVSDAVLDAPWELLAPKGIFLAADPDRLFVVTRRIGETGKPPAPVHADLSLMFMAAPLAHVIVEESGTLGFLAERLALDGPFEALHLSCHGEIVSKPSAASTQPSVNNEKSAAATDPLQGTIVACDIRTKAAVDEQYEKLRRRGVEARGRSTPTAAYKALA